MHQTKETPTFNMKVVVQETGLKPDTLRAWERRYHLPQPDRTEGRHRLYSQRDIDTLKWLMARQEEGLSISHAVELWNRLLSEGKEPLVERPIPPASSVTAVSQPTPVTGTTMTQLRQSWLASCLAFDEQGAEAALTQAFALYAPEQVCVELLQKGLYEVGQGWYEGTVTVQQEHFASALALRRLEALVAAAPRPSRTERILIGCPPHEEHTFVPLLLTMLLRRRGWDVIYLGANVPVDRLEATIKTTRPKVAIFPTQQLHTAASLPEIAEVLAKQNIPLVFGGRIFLVIPELKERVPGYFLGEGLDTAVQVVEQALRQKSVSADFTPPPSHYTQALAAFSQQQGLIESTVWQHLEESDMPYAHVVNANLHLAQNIVAALKLGDMNFLGSEITWVQGLMDNYGIDATYLPLYLAAYYDAASQHLESRGKPVVEWLAQFQAT
ncbi:MAG: B12-binding domain-containing protein [Candidatus Promineifilaceae bacterium]